MYTGSVWSQISQKGTYYVYSNYNDTTYIYNLNGDTATLNNSQALQYNTIAEFTDDGTYLLTKAKIFKRTGDVFSLYFTVPTSYGGYTLADPSLSSDGMTLIVSYNGNSGYVGFVRYTNNGSTFAYAQSVMNSYGNSSSPGYARAIISPDGGLVTNAYYSSTSQLYKVDAYFRNADGTFPSTPNTMMASYYTSSLNIADVRFSPNGNWVGISYYNGSGYTATVYTINYASKTVTQKLSIGSPHTIFGFIGDLVLWTTTTTPYASGYDLNTSITYTVATNSVFIGVNTYPFAINAGLTRVIIGGLSTKLYYMSVAVNTTSHTITFTTITSYFVSYLMPRMCSFAPN
jgi:hypothetical protein